MTLDRTQQQGEDEQRRALELSLKRVRPPTDVPGYEPQRFLGAGAYGEVWVALDRNTGRRVAIKFYAHRGGLDWSLLSREVEKLVFLSADRYVVQLLDVGWDAEPPYYVMEYIEQGSLDDRLKKDGPMRVDDAVTLLREVAIGLLHAHGKGVLHCDLKPANVLLDQDSRPRLADFGQSRLSHEQTPALGTLFYMAPEQADLRAVPDARWDVYALGALLYCMLTGAPPHRHDRAVTEIERSKDLDDRLARYRKVILNSPPPNQHRQVQGVDRALAEIIDTCLAADPKRRYANVQAVLDALDARARRRARRPLVMLGAVAPALLLLVVSLVAWRLFNAFVAESNRTLTDRAIQSDQFAAQYVAKTTANELEQRYRAVEQVAADPDFQKLVEAVENDPDLQPVLAQLSDPNQSEMELAPLRTRLIDSAPAQRLQARLAELLQTTQPAVASWFVNDNRGLSIARVPENTTVGSNFAWRSYYYGGLEDRPRTWRPGPEDQLQGPHLSVAYSSQATSNWVVSVSAPILKADNTYLGIVALTVPVDRFIEFPGDEDQFAVLVDGRAGPNQGRILQHPLFAKLVKERGKLPDRLAEYKISPDEMPADHRSIQENFSDPLADDPSGKSYQRHWLAAQAPVVLRGKDTGWAVIVQEGYDAAIGHTLENLRHSLVSSGVLAFGLITIVVTLLWAFVIRMLNDNPARNGRRGAHKNGNGDSIATARSSQTPH